MKDLIKFISENILKPKNILDKTGREIHLPIFPDNYYIEEKSLNIIYHQLILSDAKFSVNQHIEGNIIYNQINISSDNENFKKDYLLYPAKLARKFDLIIVRDDFQEDSLKYSYDLLSSKGLIICSFDDLQKYKDDFNYLKIKLNQESIIICAKDSNLISLLKIKLGIKYETLIEFSEILIKAPAVENTSFYGDNTGIIFHYYEQDFLDSIYKDAELSEMTFAEQRDYLISRSYGLSDFLSYNLKLFDFQFQDIIYNSGFSQNSWKEENTPTTETNNILLEQVKQLKPKIVIFTNTKGISKDILNEIKQHTKLLIYYKFENNLEFPFDELADIIFDINSSDNNHIKVFDAFDDRMLFERSFESRKYFCGSLIDGFKARKDELEFFNEISDKFPIEFRITNQFSLISGSPLLQKFSQVVNSNKVYDFYTNSKIVLIHNSFETSFRNIIQAAGSGAMVLTNFNRELSKFFEFGKEIAVYKSPAEAVLLLKYFFEEQSEAEAIGLSAQKRTLENYSYRELCGKIAKTIYKALE